MFRAMIGLILTCCQSQTSIMTDMNMSAFVVDAASGPSSRRLSAFGSHQGRALRQQGMLPSGRPLPRAHPTQSVDASPKVNELNLSFSTLQLK
jgi:hypothetical protein